MAQLRPLGAQRPNPNAAATFGQIRDLVALADGGLASGAEPLHRMYLNRLPPGLRDKLPGASRIGPQASSAVTRTSLPLEATYRLFAALSQGTPFYRVLNQAQQLRAGYAALVPGALVQGAVASLAELVDQLVKESPPGLLDLDAGRNRIRQELQAYVPREAEVRQLLAQVGAVDAMTLNTFTGLYGLLGNRGVGLLVRAAEGPINARDLLQEEGRTYASQLAAEVGCPIDSDAAKALPPEAMAEWARDPSFQLADLSAARAIHRTNPVLEMEARVDAELLAGGVAA